MTKKIQIEMDLLYASSEIPDHVRGGIIMFNLQDRVMSRIKNKVWKTLSHAGIVYQSMVSGKSKSWVMYMDEVYGIISCPLEEFVVVDSVVGDKSSSRPWAIRYIENFDLTTSNALNSALARHSHEDSTLLLDEDNRIAGSFDDELRSILGLPRGSDPHEQWATNTNLGFVFDVLGDFWKGMKVSEDQLVRESSVGFSEDEIVEDDLLRSFQHRGPEGFMKSVHHLLSMVNLTPHTINPPIQPLLTKPLPLFTNYLVVPSDEFYLSPLRRQPRTMVHPNITEDRKQVASVIANMFESGMGADGVSQYFEEELETTTMARRGRNELTRDLTRDLCRSLHKHLELTKTLIRDVSKRDGYLGSLHDLIVAQGSLMTHLGIDDVPIQIDLLKP
jgi:hypothetical protein